MPSWGPLSPPLTVLLYPQLILVASDLGQPVPYETMQPLQVALDDIDDNEPLFLRPPVSSHPSPAPVTPTQGFPACKPTRAYTPLCTLYHIHRLPTETCTHFTGQIFIEQLLFQGTTQTSKKQKCPTPGATFS